MPNSIDTSDWEWWCDYCLRGKQGYPSLPEDVEVEDIGGELLCDECAAATVTAVAQYNHSEETVWILYHHAKPPATETLHGTEFEKQDQHSLTEPVDVPTAIETIESYTDEESITLVPPFNEW